jgi:GNAT superfamily N-acetyltransferase
MWAFRLGDSTILSVPREHLSTIQNNAQSFSGRTIFESSALVEVTRPLQVERVIGPCFVGYLDGPALAIHKGDQVKSIDDPMSDPRVAQLRNNCGDDWETGGIELDSGSPVFGYFLDGALSAAASYEVWGGIIAHLCVVTAPNGRRKGFGKAVAAAATADAITRGLIPQWRTLESNIPSLRIANALGFDEFASHYAVRFAHA